MATSTVDVSDSGFTNIAAVKSVAPVGNEYGLTARAIIASPNNSFTASQATIPTTSTQLSNGSPDPNRRFVSIKNSTAYNLFVGGSGVGVSNGYLIEPGAAETFEVGPLKPIYGIAPSGATGTLYILEQG
jgi:hypothetical protein